MNIEDILKEGALPAMPVAAIQIMNLVNDPKSSADDIQAVITRDQALTSRVIKVATSSRYGETRRIDTISEAIVTMGLSAIKDIAIAIATKDIYNNIGPLGERLWEHAIGVSIAAGLIAQKQKVYNKKVETFIIGGLLHDIGKAILINLYPDEYAKVDQKVHAEKRAFYEIERELFGFTHQDVGAILFKQWKFSNELIELAARHHSCHHIEPDETFRSLCHIVNLADCLCLKLGVGYNTQLPELCDSEVQKMKDLAITDEGMDEIIDEFKLRFIDEKLSFMS